MKSSFKIPEFLTFLSKRSASEVMENFNKKQTVALVDPSSYSSEIRPLTIELQSSEKETDGEKVALGEVLIYWDDVMQPVETLKYDTFQKAATIFDKLVTQASAISNKNANLPAEQLDGMKQEVGKFLRSISLLKPAQSMQEGPKTEEIEGLASIDLANKKLTFKPEYVISLVGEVVEKGLDRSPESFYTTIGKKTFSSDKYHVAYWYPENIVEIDKVDSDFKVTGTVKDIEHFYKICTTLTPSPEQFGFVWDSTLQDYTKKLAFSDGAVDFKKGDRVVYVDDSNTKIYGNIELIDGDTAKVRTDSGSLFTVYLNSLDRAFEITSETAVSDELKELEDDIQALETSPFLTDQDKEDLKNLKFRYEGLRLRSKVNESLFKNAAWILEVESDGWYALSKALLHDIEGMYAGQGKVAFHTQQDANKASIFLKEEGLNVGRVYETAWPPLPGQQELFVDSTLNVNTFEQEKWFDEVVAGVEIKIKKNDFGEYEVQYVEDGKKNEKKTYYTDDKEDAQKTKKRMEEDLAKTKVADEADGAIKTAAPIVENPPEVPADLADRRIEIQQILEEAALAVSRAKKELEAKYKIAALVKEEKGIDAALMEAIQKLDTWKVKIHGWIFAVNKAGRESFMTNDFRAAVTKLVTEKAPQLLEELKALEFEATKNNTTLKLEVYEPKQEPATVFKTESSVKEANLKSALSKLVAWVSNILNPQVAAVNSTVKEIDNLMSLIVGA